MAVIQSQIHGPTIRPQVSWGTRADPSGLSSLLFQKSLDSIWFRQKSILGREPGVAGARSGLMTPQKTLLPPILPQGGRNQYRCRKGTVMVMGVRGWLCSGSSKASFPEGPKALGEQALGRRVPSPLLWFCVLSFTVTSGQKPFPFSLPSIPKDNNW